jgi:hypothetical protein
MQQPRFSFVRLAPALFASALLASTMACSITITEPEPDGECPALDELCPNLACDNGNVVVDGCPICECAAKPTCEDAEAPPDGCRLDADCNVVCDPAGCTSDADCDEGFFCAFLGGELPPDGSGDQALPAEGSCQAIFVEPGCTSDADCGEGYYCSFDGTEPPTDRAGEAAPRIEGVCLKLEETCASDIDCTVGSLCENGICVVSNECFVNEDCRPGYHCESLDAPNALIALPGGVCVPDVEPGCSSDADCNGGTCEITCESDPSCPACDVCFFVGTCIDTACTVNDDCDAGEICFFGDAAAQRPIACPDEDGDGQCDFDVPVGGVCRTENTDVICTVNADCNDGQFCDFASAERMAPPACDDLANCDPIVVVQTGVCRDLEDGCASDADCAAGEVCQLDDDCNCATVCIDDGMGGCLPCECAAPTGICVVVDTTCGSDADCRDDQICVFSDALPAPCLDADNDGLCDFDVLPPPPSGICIDVPVPACSTDADCADGEFCSFAAAGDPSGRIAPPQGTCEQVTFGPCFDVRCEAGTTCAVDASGQAVCIAEPTQCNADFDCAAGEFCVNGVCTAPAQG